MASVVNISHIFEENSCCLCGRTEVDQHSRISDNFIKYKNELISLVEVIRQTLDYELLNDSRSLGMCRMCKEKLVDFYHFKIKTHEVREVQTECSGLSAERLLIKRLLDSLTHDKAVYNTFEIVREYVEKHTVTEIKVYETAELLILKSKKAMNCEAENGIIFEEEVILQNKIINVDDDTEIEELEQVNPCSKYADEFESLVFEDLIVGGVFLSDTVTTDSGTNKSLNEIIEKEDETHKEELGDELMDHESDASDDTQTIPRNPVCEKRKSLRNTGQSYLSRSGKVMEAKKMQEPCGSSCRKNCTTKITEEERKKAFDTYWGLGDVLKQSKWLQERILLVKSRRSIVRMRNCSLQFHLESKGSDGSPVLVQVCKEMFRNTLAISVQLIKKVCDKISVQASLDFKNRVRLERKVTEGQSFATEHVKRFRFFHIEKKMTIDQFYSMYCSECRKKEIDPLDEEKYRDICLRQNLKSLDVACTFCSQYSEATDEERCSLRDEYYEHLSQEENGMCRDRASETSCHQSAIEIKKSQRKSQRTADHK